jgi:plasmid stabilization system protein ParE
MPSRRGVKYTRKAGRDLEEIADYLEEQAGESTALRMLDAVNRTVGLLRSSPHIGIASNLASGRYRRMRQIPLCASFDRWMMFYTPSATELRIHRILHSSQNWPRLFR